MKARKTKDDAHDVQPSGAPGPENGRMERSHPTWEAILQMQQSVGNRRTQGAMDLGTHAPGHGAKVAPPPFTVRSEGTRWQTDNPITTHPVQGNWLKNANPTRGKFWGKLRGALAGELENYLSNIHGEAVDTWIQHMNSGGSPVQETC